METFRDIGPLKLLEKERRQLAGMFAHDLKTPVVAVAGLLSRLRQGKAGELSETQKVYLETICQEIARLEKLITNFLDYVRLDLHIITPLPSAIQVNCTSSPRSLTVRVTQLPGGEPLMQLGRPGATCPTRRHIL